MFVCANQRSLYYLLVPGDRTDAPSREPTEWKGYGTQEEEGESSRALQDLRDPFMLAAGAALFDRFESQARVWAECANAYLANKINSLAELFS